jgi:hypothetical protein
MIIQKYHSAKYMLETIFCQYLNVWRLLFCYFIAVCRMRKFNRLYDVNIHLSKTKATRGYVRVSVKDRLPTRKRKQDLKLSMGHQLRKVCLRDVWHPVTMSLFAIKLKYNVNFGYLTNCLTQGLIIDNRTIVQYFISLSQRLTSWKSSP